MIPSNADLTGIKCPVCGEHVSVRALVSPGEPMVMYYPDGSGYPGSPPEVEEIDEPEYNCYCRDGIITYAQTSYRKSASNPGVKEPYNRLLEAYRLDIEDQIERADFILDEEDY